MGTFFGAYSPEFSISQKGYNRIRETETYGDLPSGYKIVKEFGSWNNFWHELGMPSKQKLVRKFSSVRITLLDRHKKSNDGRIPSKEEFLTELEELAKHANPIYVPYLNEETLNLLFHGVENYILSGLWNKYEALRGSGKNKDEARGELGLSRSDFDRLLGKVPRSVLIDQYGSLDILVNNEIEGVDNPNGPNKRRLRSMIPRSIEDHLKSRNQRRKINYLGLENVNFRSYLEVFNNVNGVSNEDSLVVEGDFRRYNIMKSILENWDVWGTKRKPVFRCLNLELGMLNEVLEKLSSDNFTFNLINLDYDGPFSPEKNYTLKLLFEKGFIEAPALLFLDLNNEPGKREIVRRIYQPRYGVPTQEELLGNFLQEQRNQFAITQLHSEAYKDSANMLFFGYLIDKKN